MNQVNIIKQDAIEEHVYFDFMNTSFDRRFSNEVVEITSSYIASNEGLVIAPIKNDNIIKSFYVVCGSFLHLESNKVLTQGDSIVVQSKDNHTILYALESSEVLGHCINTRVYEQDMLTGNSIARALNKIQEKDSYTGEHCYRVQRLVQKMALYLNYSGTRMVNMMIASRHHDIGKVYIDDSILNKPSQLTDEEYEVMKTHVQHGADILVDKFSESAFKIIEQHHERVDGSGYPYGLTADQLSDEAKLLAICDSYDAMTVDRVYKRGKSHSESLQELKALAGSKYDAYLIDVFSKVVDMSYLDICRSRMGTKLGDKENLKKIV